MGKKLIRWSVTGLGQMITKILQNKFDCFIIIEGNRGLGKSTLAVHLARRNSTNFKKMGSKDYRFNWKSSLVYTKKETKRLLHAWRRTGIVDEAINVAFNRDFYDTEQKDIIKMLNMNRDHSNLIIACVPQFQTLDSQLKNLCKIRISVVRRGFAIIQTPNQTIYVKDKWDSATNEKLEREWLKKGIKNPHYTRLTTFRGVVKFSALSDVAEEKYQKVKDEKRNLVAKEEMGINEQIKEETDPVNIAYERLRTGRIRNSVFLEGFAEGHGLNPSTFKGRLQRKLKAEGVNSSLSAYYWDKKEKKEEEVASL